MIQRTINKEEETKNVKKADYYISSLFTGICFLLSYSLLLFSYQHREMIKPIINLFRATVKMPELATVLEEAFRTERLMASSTDTAVGVEVLTCSDDVPAGDGFAATSAARHVLGVALCAERQAVVVLEELCKGEETLTASVALEAFLVEPVAKSHDSIALVGDVLVAQETDKTGLLWTVLHDLDATKISDLVSRLQL